MTSKEALNIIAKHCAMNCHKVLENECFKGCEVKQAFNKITEDLEVLHKLGARLIAIKIEIDQKIKAIEKLDTISFAYRKDEYDILNKFNRVYIDDLVNIISKLWSNEK